MSNQYCGGVVENRAVKEEVDDDLYAAVLAVRDKAEKCMDTLHVADCLTEILGIFKRCNKYIDETEPWVLAKDEDKKDRLSTVLYNLLDCIAIGAALLQSFLPGTAEKIFGQLNTKEPDFDDLDKPGVFVSGTKVTSDPETLFERKKFNDVMKIVDELYPPKKKGDK